MATLVGALALVLALPVQAGAEINTHAEITWGVYGLDTSTETDQIRSLVFAIEQIGDTIYVGGKFLEARPSANGAASAQPYLAAFNASTGAFISSFRPQLESAVYALEASPDGSRLFVAGEFRSIDGDTEAHGLAALDPVTGAVDTTWRSKLANTSGARPMVMSLTTSGSQLYASGRFDRVGGMSRPLHHTDKVTRVSVADGTVDTSLTTDIDGGAVWGVAVAPDASKIYLAGYHDLVDGNPAGADYSVLNPDGSLIPSWSDHGRQQLVAQPLVRPGHRGHQRPDLLGRQRAHRAGLLRRRRLTGAGAQHRPGRRLPGPRGRRRPGLRRLPLLHQPLRRLRLVERRRHPRPRGAGHPHPLRGRLLRHHR